MKESRKKASTPGYGTGLDAWISPPNFGTPVGCIATSYTFNAVFFEEECLARFLRLSSDPDDTEDPSYLIEREEKLSTTTCLALVDQRHCKGNRSLRWDLVAVRLPRGSFHPKISFLYWSQGIRIVISSANLTEPGYRTNQEIYGVLDFFQGASASRANLKDCFEFLRECLGYGTLDPKVANVAVNRARRLLDSAEEISKKWKFTNETTSVRIEPIFYTPARKKTVFRQLQDHWQALGGPLPYNAEVTSPFFDPPGDQNAPASALWELLSPRGQTWVRYQVLTTPIAGTEKVMAWAPESLVHATPKDRKGAKTEFLKIDPKDPASGIKRSLHMKSLWLNNDKWNTYLIGSSNFTSPGMGLNPINVEANLIYIARRDKDPDVSKNILAACLFDEDIQDSSIDSWIPPLNEDQAEDDPQSLLPRGFVEAVYELDPKIGPILRLAFNPLKLPSSWRLAFDFPGDGLKDIYNSRAWKLEKSPTTVSLPWPHPMPPSGIDVFWADATKSAWWPVVVEKVESLLPPEQLRDLSLDALINVLSSARPLHQSLGEWLKRSKRKVGASANDISLDPHSRVDTSSFLLQRTRRISKLFRTLCDRLAKPVTNAESLNWRLRGPIGVQAVVTAIEREFIGDMHRSFLLVELCLELSRIEPQEIPKAGNLPASTVRKALRTMIEEIAHRIDTRGEEQSAALKGYIDRSLREARQ